MRNTIYAALCFSFFMCMSIIPLPANAEKPDSKIGLQVGNIQNIDVFPNVMCAFSSAKSSRSDNFLFAEGDISVNGKYQYCAIINLDGKDVILQRSYENKSSSIFKDKEIILKVDYNFLNQK